MSKDREYREKHGLSQREFSRILLSAQRKRGTKEPMTQQEQEVWDLAWLPEEKQKVFR